MWKNERETVFVTKKLNKAVFVLECLFAINSPPPSRSEGLSLIEHSSAADSDNFLILYRQNAQGRAKGWPVLRRV